MNNKDEEYREIFLAEALDSFAEINRLMTVLEKNAKDKNSINALFRITHTLKGNAYGMGYTGIAEMSHVLEDLFDAMRGGELELQEDSFSAVFKGIDVLGALINAIQDNATVKYKGIKTKLEVIVKRAHELSNSAEDAAQAPASTTDAEITQEVQSFNTESIKEVKSSVENFISNANSPFNPEAAMESLKASGQEEAESPDEADAKISFSDLVQVPVRKLDILLNLVGELIIEKDRIQAANAGLYGSNEYARLSRICSDLQYSIMDVRLVQIGFLFNKFHRVVRDAAVLEKKQVSLKVEGADTEIDRNVLQVISNSLIHIIRNAVGHGIEDVKQRKKAGKPEEGTVWLSAKSETDSVIIKIADDGKGLDYYLIKRKAIAKGLITEEEASKCTVDELAMLIFEPGFSTAEQVTAISGRGVGMDVVKRTIDSIGGVVEITSEPGRGTTMTLTLPSSMAVKSCLLFEMGVDVYAIPLTYTESVISLYKSDIHKAGGGLIASHLNKNITIVFLRDVFNPPDEKQGNPNILQHSFNDLHPETKLEIVVVNFNNKVVGFVVDKLLQQKEIVEKPLMKPVENVKFVSGVTILGTGKVCLVLNIASLLHYILN
jgi:two-component system, chemotaxis family, sensor kinase CheA